MAQNASKTVVWDTCRMVVELFNDVQRSFPAISKNLEKDLEDLLRAVQERGINTLCVDLPNICKAFDRALDDGQWTPPGLPLSAPCAGNGGSVLPQLFGCLFSYVFEDSGLLRKDYSHEAIICIRQLLRCCKKIAIECSKEAVGRAVQSFLETEYSLPLPVQYWFEEDTSFEEIEKTFPGFRWSARYASNTTSLIRSVEGDNPSTAEKEIAAFLCALDQVSGRMATEFQYFHTEKWSSKHGPGAVSDQADMEDKYIFRNWPERLDSAFPISDHVFNTYRWWASHFRDLRRVIRSRERSSRMCAVPKTLDKPRLIAAEPVEHMWCQQFVRDAMYRTVEESWLGNFIPLRDQEFSRRTCLRASLTGELATLDLSDASDRVSCEFVGNLFRACPRLLEALRASRTLTCDIDAELCNSAKGTIVLLRKYATMGNATTFPVESLGFLCIAIAACLTVYKQPVTRRNIDRLVNKVVVFGDDIIVPKECAGFVTLALEVLDFKVNRDKSFSKGNFRESCGMEAFGGQEVTTTYICLPPVTKNPTLICAAVDTSNNLYRRGWLAAAEYLRVRVRKFYNIPYVSDQSGTLGFWTRGKLPNPLKLYKLRWNRSLWRAEALVASTISRSDRETRPSYQGDVNLLQYFTEKPAPLTKWKAGFCSRPARMQILARWVPITDLGYDVNVVRHDSAPAQS